MEIEILAELKNRKSPIVFDERDFDAEKIWAIVEAARWAPSCSNNQSWNYVFVHKTDTTRIPLERALTPGNAGQRKRLI